MPNYQFCLYEIKIRPLRKKDSFRLVSEFNPSKHDLIEVIQKFMENEMGTTGIKIDRSEHYIRLMGIETTGRIIWPTVESGHFGSTGQVVDTSTGSNAYPISSDDAPAYPLRQGIIVPRSGFSAIWATETVGNTSSMTSLWNSLSEWFRKEYESEGLILEKMPLQNTDAWNEFIEQSQLREIKYVVQVQDTDNAVGVRTMEFTAKSGRGMRLAKTWIDRALEKKLPPGTVFSVEGLPEPSEVHLEIMREGKSRTIIVGREFPRFMYPIESPSGSSPSDETFRREVLSEVGASLDLMGVGRGDWQA